MCVEIDWSTYTARRVQEDLFGLLRKEGGLGVQGTLLDDLREGVQGVRLPQEVLPRAQATLQADTGQGWEKGRSRVC